MEDTTTPSLPYLFKMNRVSSDINYLLIILLVGFSVYFNSLFCNIITGDDQEIINYHVETGKISLENSNSFLDSLIYQFVGKSPKGYHFLNILLHLIVCVLVFYFLKIFFDIEASFYGALLFTVLPIHTEAVTWIAGKPHILIALCFLGSFLAFHYNQFPISMLLFFLGFYPGINKINLVNLWLGMVPVFFIIYLLVYKRFKELYKVGAYLICYISIVLFYLKDINDRISDTAVNFKSTASNIWITFIYSIYNHFWLMIYPKNLVLYHENINVDLFAVWWGTLGIIIFGGSLVYIYKKSKPLFLGLAIFFLFLSPTFSPKPLSWVIAERYAYLPSILVSVIAACLISSRYKNVVITILFPLLFLYGIRTVDRNADYKTDERFRRATLASAPYSPKARNDMGVIYARESNIIKAAQEFRNALKLNPDFKEAKDNMDLVIKAVKKGITIKY